MDAEELPFRDRIKTVNFGTPRKPRVAVDREADVKHVELLAERDGGYGGHQTHHPDGTFDCRVQADPLSMSLTPREPA